VLITVLCRGDFTNHLAALRRLQTVYFALQITGGHVGLVVVLAFSAFSNSVRYEFTFMNFCTTWVFSSVVFSIMSVLLSAGRSMDLPLAIYTGCTVVLTIIMSPILWAKYNRVRVLLRLRLPKPHR
jgi:hypothetical protein